jgi:large subunit ribosomal protein L21
LKLVKPPVKIAFMIRKDKYAVIKTGGKQYLVVEAQVLDIEKIEGKKGDKVSFDEVLLIKDKKLFFGSPILKKAKVKAEIVDQFKDKKIRVATYKAKSRYRRVKGHRQRKTKIKIFKITS